jgi:hypothetical protein
MRATRWCAVLLLGLPLAGNAVMPVKSVDFSAGAWVDVDPSGHAHVTEMDKVSGLEDVPKLVPIAEDIKARLRVRIEGWQFVPASRDGVPAASRTHVHVAMQGADDGSGGLAVRILSALTGPEFSEGNRRGLIDAGMRAGEAGRVTIDVEYSAAGNVISAAAAPDSTVDKYRSFGRASKELRRAMLKAALKWTFIPEQVAGQPIAGGGRIPVVFCLEVCPAVEDKGSGGGTEAQFAAADPAVKLQNDVAGTAL